MQPDLIFSDADATLKLQGNIVACTAKELRLAATDNTIRRALVHDPATNRLVVNFGADYGGGVAVVEKLAIEAKTGTFSVDNLQPDKNGNIVPLSVKELDLVKQIQELRTAVANLNKALGVNAAGDVKASEAFSKLQQDVAALGKQNADLESKIQNLLYVVSWLQGYVNFVANFTGAAKAWHLLRNTLKNPTVPKKEIPPTFPPVWPP